MVKDMETVAAPQYGARLRTFLRKKSLSQKELAQMLGVPESTVSFWVNAQYPPLESIDRICRALEIPLAHFFSTDDDVVYLTDSEKQFVRIYNQFPLKLQGMLIDVVSSFLAAYIEGARSD